MFGLFKKKANAEPSIQPPEIMGLRMGCAFELDALHLKLLDSHITASGISHTHIIEGVGRVDLDDTTILRFYTDDEAFLQVVCQGPLEEDNIIDVKLFHYYSTENISTDYDWSNLLNTKIGTEEYVFEGKPYSRVWSSSSTYHPPVAMTEKTFSENGNISQTDQFIMLFERFLDEENTESLLLSAEEVIDEHDNIDRCFVVSTGVVITPTQITIHG